MKKLLWFIGRLFRYVRWLLRCAWLGKVVPRREPKLFSRTFMRKVWSGRLKGLDREYNKTRNRFLLWDRRIMVAKRRAYRFS
jgi:hypothetical protein